jgi:hypothetical protein
LRAAGEVLNAGQCPRCTTTTSTAGAGGVVAIVVQVCASGRGCRAKLGGVGVDGGNQHIRGAGVTNHQVHLVLQHTVTPSLQRGTAEHGCLLVKVGREGKLAPVLTMTQSADAFACVTTQVTPSSHKPGPMARSGEQSRDVGSHLLHYMVSLQLSTHAFWTAEPASYSPLW